MSNPHFHVNRSLLSTAERTGRLDLHGYSLSSLPSDLFTPSLINSLQSLDLGQNRFRELPADINKFYHLKELILDENPLKSLSTALLECRQLKWIGLNDMPCLDEKFMTIYQKCTRHNKTRTRDAVPILRAIADGGAGPSTHIASDDDSLSKYVRENSPHIVAPASIPPASLADQFISRGEAAKKNRDISSVSHIFHEEEKEAYHAGKRRDQVHNQQKSSIFDNAEEGGTSPTSHKVGKRMGGFESYSGQQPSLIKQNSGSRYQHTPKMSVAPFATNAQQESTPSSNYRPSRRQSKPAMAVDAPYGTAPSHGAGNHFLSSAAEAQATVLAAKAGEDYDRRQNNNNNDNNNFPPRSKGGYVPQEPSALNSVAPHPYLGDKPVSEMTDEEVKELAKKLLEEEKYLDDLERENHPTGGYDSHYQPQSPAAVPSAASPHVPRQAVVKGTKADPLSLPAAGVARVNGGISTIGGGKRGQEAQAPISQIFVEEGSNKPRVGKRISAAKVSGDRRAPFGRIEDGENNQQPVSQSAPAPAYRPPWGLSIDQQSAAVPKSSYQQRQERAPISQIFGDGITNPARKGKGRGAQL